MNREYEFREMAKYVVASLDTKESVLEKLLKEVGNRNHIILSGPPGTGKTRNVDLLLKAISNEIGLVHTVQFHPSYSYQDFIEGYSIVNGKYEPKAGLLLNLLEQAKQVEDGKFVILVIDEINRGDIPSIFGELMMLLDRDETRSVTTSKFSSVLKVPDNFIIIGTMNTADKNIKQLDLALRRRFKFIFVNPDYDGLLEWLHSLGWHVSEFTAEQYIQAIKKINNRIITHPTLGKNMMLGQSLFVPKVKESIRIHDLVDVFNDTILPQFEAYIGFGNKKDLDELLGTPDVRLKLSKGSCINENDLSNLMSVLNSSKE